MTKYYVVYSQDELYHHGTKGQKWGIRRWQNADGSLTPAGREHYGYNKPRDRLTGKEKITQVYVNARVKHDMNKHKQKQAEQLAKARASKAEKKKLEQIEKEASEAAKQEAEKKQKEIESIIDKAYKKGDAKTLFKYKEHLSDQQLTDAVKRLSSLDTVYKKIPEKKSLITKAEKWSKDFETMVTTANRFKTSAEKGYDFYKSMEEALNKFQESKKAKHSDESENEIFTSYLIAGDDD